MQFLVSLFQVLGLLGFIEIHSLNHFYSCWLFPSLQMRQWGLLRYESLTYMSPIKEVAAESGEMGGLELVQGK